MHTHMHTYSHIPRVCKQALTDTCTYAHTQYTLTHTPLTHEYPYAHAAHTCLHAYTCMLIYTCAHMTPFTLQPEKLRCTTVGVSAACKVTGPQNVPWDLGMLSLSSGTPPCCSHVPSKEAARMPAFLSSKTLYLCQGSRGRERCTARAQMAEQPQAGTFSQAFKKNTFFPA